MNNYIWDIGTHSLGTCIGTNCCLTDPSKCGGATQRSAATCSICGTTSGVAPVCFGGGGECVAAAASYIAASMLNMGKTLPTPPMLCSALLSLKSSLGVTFTSWATSVPCQVAGKQAATQTTWPGVLCGDTGDGLKGSIHADISKLTALTYLDFGYNLFQGRLDSFTAPLKNVPSLKALGLYSNYLTGTIPILSTSLVALDVGFNYLSGSFPNLSLKSCSADHNCLLSSTYCRSSGLLQRPASACAICGPADNLWELCYGGLCGPDSADAVSEGTVNSPALPMVPMKCLGSPVVAMNTASASALLSVKSSLGVTDSTWVAASSCTIGNAETSLPDTWNGVGCSVSGAVISLNVTSMGLSGSVQADISKLTALRSMSVPLSFFPSESPQFSFFSSPPSPRSSPCPAPSASLSLSLFLIC
ncbi:unnamed protein product [Closterium sp. Naga37s-1]|nr:unnamed protein product [Closterium sp. Naga37s-1]